MSGVNETGKPFLHNHGDKVGRAKVFMHGGSQAVRLPKAFRVEGDEVNVRREGDKVILEAKRRQGGPGLWARIDAIRIDEPLAYPPQPVIEDFGGFDE